MSDMICAFCLCGWFDVVLASILIAGRTMTEVLASGWPLSVWLLGPSNGRGSDGSLYEGSVVEYAVRGRVRPMVRKM
jgi:hypothetical protein